LKSDKVVAASCRCCGWAAWSAGRRGHGGQADSGGQGGNDGDPAHRAQGHGDSLLARVAVRGDPLASWHLPGNPEDADGFLPVVYE
jgi:hypothetical protein